MNIKTLSGFTLTELLVAVAILAILLGVAAPSFSEIALTSKLTNAANRLVASATLARTEAIKRNVTVTMCMSANVTASSPTCTTSGNWAQGWIVYRQIDTTTNEVLHRETGILSGYKVNGTVNAINFDPVGFGTTQATLTVCRYAPTTGTQERVVTVSATGKAATKKTTTGTCS